MAASHSHRSTTKVGHKAFKSRHSTKSELRDRSKGKIEKPSRQTRSQHVLSKLDRRNQAKQRRVNAHAAHVKASSVFAGREGAPRIIAVVPLGTNVNVKEAARQLAESVEAVDAVEEGAGVRRVFVERFKQNVAYLLVERELFAVLDACRMADFVVWVLDSGEEVDETGVTLLRAVESQGISTVMAAVQNLDSLDSSKKKIQTLATLKSFMTHFFPAIEKVNSLDSSQECQNVMRVLCTTNPKGIYWREDRSWMMVEDVRWSGGKAVDNPDGTQDVIITGVVRGKGLKADRLVQVGDWGDFQIDKILAAPLPKAKKMRGDNMAIDAEGDGEILEIPTDDQDDLAELAPEEVVMEGFDRGTMATSTRKGVLIDDHHYYSDEDEEELITKPRRLPRGTSDYQAAWYLGDMSDSGSDMEDVEDVDMGFEGPSNNPADGPVDIDMRDPTEAGGTEYPQSEAFQDPSPEDEAEQIASYRKQRHEEAEEDLEFPDEIELPPNVLARDRLARYRGLKNLRTSIWDTEEDKLHQPEEWQRLLEVANYKATKNKIIKDAQFGGVPPGMRVHVHLKGVPSSLQDSHNKDRPLAMYSLLRHEHKRTAVNFSILLSSDLEKPLRSKEEIILQCGPRRFIINPLFSDQGNTPNNVHKFKRYLHPGQAGVASFIGPLTWGSVPVLYFKAASSEMETDFALHKPFEFIGTGTSLPPSHNRVIAKRIILSGHPFKINKRVVTIRYMFFNTEDIAWFKALRLWTKRGRSGYIKESLGTHGYFKATFDGKINPMDSVSLSLYKRVWPRQARVLTHC
ncbi:putative pre-rRNA processing protein Tsr1 [Microthyrium microscopicum]|uniref:Putative pre-rRNA processing protein Tsr1 n=1 Tax=Microthyrium microscopicum TaxID=703497 RepID=A0A6A6U6Q4_9PEZI|nr:putative pre-rRNA processing protein Tsr1 [Microthyrium microscopicum]